MTPAFLTLSFFLGYAYEDIGTWILILFLPGLALGWILGRIEDEFRDLCEPNLTAVHWPTWEDVQ